MAWDFKSLLARWRDASSPERASGLACTLAGAGLLAWAARLWPEWTHNADLSHGFLAVPAVVLLWIRAQEDAPGSRGLGGGAQLVLSGLAGAGLLGASLLATVYAVAMGWASTPTLFLLSAAAAAGLALAATLAAGRGVRRIAAGWPALVMLAVVLLSAPLPPGSYARLTSGLQEAITVGVVGTLRLFGVPALRSGNIIDLGMTSVGVEEACSGVRSLVSCVLAGLVLSALMLKSPLRRLVLAGVAAPLALATNFARSLALTLLARNGVDITGAWHDGLGYAVLLVTTGLLAALAFLLEEKPTKGSGEPGAGSKEPGARSGEQGAGVVPSGAWAKDGAWAASAPGLACLVLALGWFGYVAARTERGAPSAAGPAPELARLVPEAAEGWTVATRGDLDRFAGILQTDHLLERVYSKNGDEANDARVTVYVAWWPAGAASVSAVAAHTPDACWPGAGWVAAPKGDGRRDLPLSDGGAALGAEQRTFRYGDYPQRVWFWHLVAGEPMRTFDPRSWREQLRVFFQQGVRRDQTQAFVRVSSNLDWAELAADPLIAEVMAGFAELGVKVRAPAAR